MIRLRVTLVVGLLLAGGTAAAQDRSFSPQLFHPAPGPDRFVDVESAVPIGHKSWGIGLFFNYARNELQLNGFNTDTMMPSGAHADLIAHALGADLWAGVGLWNRLQIAIALPMTLYQTGEDFDDTTTLPRGPHVSAPNGFAFGDPRLHLKVRLYGKETGFQISISHWLSFPLGKDDDFGGEHHFDGFAGEPRLLLGWEASRWRVGAFAGFLWRAHSSAFFSTVVGQQLTYGGAGAFDVVKQRFTLILELYGHSNSFDSLAGIKDVNDGPLELDLAGRVVVARNLSLTAGVGYGVLPGVGAPQPRAYLGLTYTLDTRDRDHDGIPDAFDQCPDQPEDKDGFQDRDGCPDLDNDNDTILDSVDKCPNQPEDFDGFEDLDGCPDPDNDKDGVLDSEDRCPNDKEDGKPPRPADGCPVSKTDSDGDGVMDDKDKCPNEPEDKDGFQDDDGCPDPDNDGDGIPDNFDQCPNAAEDMDGFEDEDGCPDPDNDKDGVPDKLDKCPNEPETINGYQDEDGCPDKGPPSKVKVENGQIVILEKIFFDTNKARIKPVSFPLLDQVAQVIRGHAEFKIRIEGHTDSQGNQDHNIQLSKERAEAVRTYLIKKNIEPERLISVGYGPAMPIADNKTNAGREANRRVEFHIMEPEKTKQPEQQPEQPQQ
jgi:outer membrane protein OmpA-like peptidoglycan-associated protein